MTPRTFARAYLVAALVFVAMDAVWLGAMAQRLYRPAIGHLMAEQFSAAPALAFYALYLGGIVFFAVLPALGAGRAAAQALLRGALLGLLAYGTYDLTNQATLRGWPWHVTLIDLCWGAVVTGAAAMAATADAARAATRTRR